jgi:Hemerythrin HHE cation binding domain
VSVDFTMMLTYHDALRRDVAAVAEVARVAGDDPRRLWVTHVGWRRFTRFLVVHHTAEDEVLWPLVHEALEERPDDVALLDAMEAEHALIDPLIAAVEELLLDPAHAADRLGDVADEFAHQLGAHLRHEEEDTLPLIARTLSGADWEAFAAEQRGRNGLGSAPTQLPWLLGGATPDRVSAVLGQLPAALAADYPGWRAAYDAADPWPGRRQADRPTSPS